MSIPTHFNGSLLNIMGGGGGSAPAGPTISLLRITTTGSTERGPPQFSQLYFGAETATATNYTSKATFLAANPGLTLQDFTGVAGAGSFAVVTSFTGFSVVATIAGTPNGQMQVWDTTFPASTGPYPTAVFDSLVSTFAGSQTISRDCDITFSPAVTAVGLNVARLSNISPYTMTIQWFNGVTLLNTQTLVAGSNPPLLIDVYTTFAGYAA